MQFCQLYLNKTMKKLFPRPLLFEWCADAHMMAWLRVVCFCIKPLLWPPFCDWFQWAPGLLRVLQGIYLSSQEHVSTHRTNSLSSQDHIMTHRTNKTSWEIHTSLKFPLILQLESPGSKILHPGSKWTRILWLHLLHPL